MRRGKHESPLQRCRESIAAHIPNPDQKIQSSAPAATTFRPNGLSRVAVRFGRDLIILPCMGAIKAWQQRVYLFSSRLRAGEKECFPAASAVLAQGELQMVPGSFRHQIRKR